MNKQVKVGDRIKQVHTHDPFSRLKAGDRTCWDITELSNEQIIWIHWDSGSKLAMIEGKDKFEIA
jgi:hypothetical protein